VAEHRIGNAEIKGLNPLDALNVLLGFIRYFVLIASIPARIRLNELENISSFAWKL